MQNKKIAVIGAGIGGLAAARLLLDDGFDVDVYEQAPKFTRIGAGIQMTPNAVKVLRRLGLEDQLVQTAFQAPIRLSREHDSGKETFALKSGDSKALYGAPFLLLHRGDLHEALASRVPADRIHLDRKLAGIAETGDGVSLRFADGATETADAVVAADGVHSVVREALFGHENPRYTGRAAYRATFPASLMGKNAMADHTKWWGPDRHIVIYYIRADRSEIYFIASVPEEEDKESWSREGDMNHLRNAYASFHPEVRAVLDACPASFKWAIYDREPFPVWTKGNITLLGDACHPMTPYMAQGAAMALEDAVVLARCLKEESSFNRAFRRYEATRRERTAQMQAGSSTNTWFKGNTDPGWVFGYDANTAPLASVS